MTALLTINKCQSLYEDYIRTSSDSNAGFSFTQLTFVIINYEVLKVDTFRLRISI